MSYPPSEGELTQDRLNLLIHGFNNLKDGALFMLIGELLASISLVGLIFPGMAASQSLGALLVGAAGLLGLGLIGGIISLIGLLKWKDAGKYFKQFDPLRLGYGESGPKYMLYAIIIIIFGLIIALLGALGTAVTGGGGVLGVAFLGIGIVIIGAIVYLIGIILFGLFLLRLDEIKAMGVNIPEFKLDAILWFIGIIFSILTLIAVILIYMHSKEAIDRLRIQPTIQQPTY